jgi:hypothetical protein
VPFEVLFKVEIVEIIDDLCQRSLYLTEVNLPDIRMLKRLKMSDLS